MRPYLSARHPVHVVMRSNRRLNWRNGGMYRVLRLVLAAMLDRKDSFRIIHISIQRNHLHLIVEAANRDALTAGIASFTIRAVRAIHKADGGCGEVFPYRYFANQITTARYARHALAYVLNNWRRHREDWECAAANAAKLDPYSSALSFDGWTQRFAVPAGYIPLPVSPPQTSLLRFEWQQFGRIDPLERPGPIWK